jgi:hypothetical protein
VNEQNVTVREISYALAYRRTDQSIDQSIRQRDAAVIVAIYKYIMLK